MKITCQINNKIHNWSIYQWILLSFVLLLTSCALYGPSYSKPVIDVDSKWVSKDKIAEVESGVDLSNVAWWGKFNDAQLNGLIESALNNNLNIEMAIGNILQAKGILEQVQMLWVPNVGGQFSYNSNQQVGAVNNNLTNANPSLISGTGVNGYSTGFVPNYSVNIFSQLRSQEAAKAGLMAAQYTKDAVRLTVISQVVGGYFTLIGQDYQLKIQQELVKDLKQQYDIGLGQYKLGYISLLALQTIEQSYYSAKATIPIIKNNIVQSKNALRVLTNQNPGDITRTADFMNITVDGIIPVGLPSDVLKQRPDIMQAEEQLKQANANIGVATSSFFPTVSLTGLLGSASPGLNGLFGANTDFWQNQIQATMPFLNLSILGQIKGAKGVYYNAYYNYINVVRTAFSQVDNGLSAHQQLTKSYNIQNMQYKSTKLGFELGNQRYLEGMDSYSVMLQYKITMDNGALALINIKQQQLKSIVNLYQSVAGGYNINNTNAPKKFNDSHDS